MILLSPIEYFWEAGKDEQLNILIADIQSLELSFALDCNTLN